MYAWSCARISLSLAASSVAILASDWACCSWIFRLSYCSLRLSIWLDSALALARVALRLGVPEAGAADVALATPAGSMATQTAAAPARATVRPAKRQTPEGFDRAEFNRAELNRAELNPAWLNPAWLNTDCRGTCQLCGMRLTYCLLSSA